MSAITLVVTTVSDCEAGVALVKSLLGRRVIACGQIFPEGRSLYRWKGELRDETECTVLLKTSLVLKDRIADLVCKNHPYELPEILVFEVDATPEYSSWVAQEVQES